MRFSLFSSRNLFAFICASKDVLFYTVFSTLYYHRGLSPNLSGGSNIFLIYSDIFNSEEEVLYVIVLKVLDVMALMELLHVMALGEVLYVMILEEILYVMVPKEVLYVMALKEVLFVMVLKEYMS